MTGHPESTALEGLAGEKRPLECSDRICFYYLFIYLLVVQQRGTYSAPIFYLSSFIMETGPLAFGRDEVGVPPAQRCLATGNFDGRNSHHIAINYNGRSNQHYSSEFRAHEVRIKL